MHDDDDLSSGFDSRDIASATGNLPGDLLPLIDVVDSDELDVTFVFGALSEVSKMRQHPSAAAHEPTLTRLHRSRPGAKTNFRVACAAYFETMC
jgi:hypothetical protein